MRRTIFSSNRRDVKVTEAVEKVLRELQKGLLFVEGLVKIRAK